MFSVRVLPLVLLQNYFLVGDFYPGGQQPCLPTCQSAHFGCKVLISLELPVGMYPWCPVPHQHFLKCVHLKMRMLPDLLVSVQIRTRNTGKPEFQMLVYHVGSRTLSLLPPQSCSSRKLEWGSGQVCRVKHWHPNHCQAKHLPTCFHLIETENAVGIHP